MQSDDAPRDPEATLKAAFIVMISLALCACATQEYVRSITYDYTGQTRALAEMRARQEIWDTCYFSGAQYPAFDGPPQIVSEGGVTVGRFHATQSFTCIGTRGEGP